MTSTARYYTKSWHSKYLINATNGHRITTFLLPCALIYTPAVYADGSIFIGQPMLKKYAENWNCNKYSNPTSNHANLTRPTAIYIKWKLNTTFYSRINKAPCNGVILLQQIKKTLKQTNHLFLLPHMPLYTPPAHFRASLKLLIWPQLNNPCMAPFLLVI